MLSEAPLPYRRLRGESNREIVFVSLRASGRGEAACGRETMCLPVAGDFFGQYSSGPVPLFAVPLVVSRFLSWCPSELVFVFEGFAGYKLLCGTQRNSESNEYAVSAWKTYNSETTRRCFPCLLPGPVGPTGFF